MKQSEAIKYYSDEEIAKELVRVAQDREIAIQFQGGRYGKRPMILEFPGDVSKLVRRGALSFHMSEERWHDPLELSPETTSAGLDKLRKTWDFVLDIDSPWFNISTSTAKLMVDALKHHDIENVYVKFSGNKGWHIVVPAEAFPEKVGKKSFSDLYPGAAQTMASYLMEFIKPHLEQEILDSNDNDLKKISEMIKMEKDEFFDSKTGKFKQNIFSQIDIILASPRHMFRMPYSLNEKSGFVSIPIKPEFILSFKKEWAKPENVSKMKVPFLDRDSVTPGEATQLLVAALDWEEKKTVPKKKGFTDEYGVSIARYDFTTKVGEEHFPPCIKKILNGLEDGRKRSLFVLINFLRNSKWEWSEIEERIEEWNKKNKTPLKKGYINSQLNWAKRQPHSLKPPGCKNSQYYKDIGVCSPEQICRSINNPLGYLNLKLRRTAKKPAKTKSKT